jgi:FlaA1/EpsC-like NDP-sugar epimerase
MYRRYWQDAGPGELLLAARASLITGFIIWATVLLVNLLPSLVIPRSIALIDMLLVFAFTLASRFAPRAQIYVARNASSTRHQSTNSARILIVGAGLTGTQVLAALEKAGQRGQIVGFLDDHTEKIGRIVRGIAVIGRTDDLAAVCRDHKIKRVIIAIPSASGLFIRKIVDICRTLKVEYSIVPGVAELVSGRITVNALRPVAIDDLLRRMPVELDVSNIQAKIAGKCVMITGAGGTIGSELTRQIARFQPGQLILVGHGENSLFWIDAKLRDEFPHIPRTVLLADIRDMRRMTAIFEAWHPELIFHAAAHKHVPMLETNLSEAVSNNIQGTNNLINLSNQFDVECMVMVSTDKAVEPTNVMGMSKRAAEMLMISAATDHPQRFACVRFGNVLGSRGSVVPIFQQQIAVGGPITITDKQMTRFFMSIPEAVLLVLKASVLVSQSSLFVLNMGEPVPIIELANDVIRLSGLEPNRDIEIRETGSRPGEKLYEELFWKYEQLQSLENGAIFAIKTTPEIHQQIHAKCLDNIHVLIQTAEQCDDATIKKMLQQIVFSVKTPDSSREVTRKHREQAAQDVETTPSMALRQSTSFTRPI